MTYGWISISDCFTKEQAEEWAKDLWTRLGYDKNDSSTWVLEKINMPLLKYIDARELALKAWGAICELSGGEDRIEDICRQWGDNFIVNFGNERKTLKELGVDSLPNWKIKGERETLRPERENIHARVKELELRRLGGKNVGPVGDTGVEVHRELVKGLVWKKPEM